MSLLSSRVRRRGCTPFIFRAPPPKKQQKWISRVEFLYKLSPDLQKDYARVFRVPGAETMDADDLYKMFCAHNTMLPLLPIHVRRGKKKKAIHRRPSYKKTLKKILSMENDPALDGPWRPKVSTIPERLVPAPDVYEDSKGPKKTLHQRPSWTPPSRIEHELVYPPRAPVVGRYKTGKAIVQPLSQDWLQVMLEEQEERYQALKSELRASVAAAKAAASEVTMVRAMLKDEQAESDNFLIEIGRICGQEIVDEIKEMAEFGAEHGFLEHPGILDEDYNSDVDNDEADYENATTVPPEANSFPLSGLVPWPTGRPFSKRPREDEDEPVKDKASETQEDIRPFKKRRRSPSESIPPPPRPRRLVPYGVNLKNPRFFIDTNTGLVIQNERHPAFKPIEKEIATPE